MPELPEVEIYKRYFNRHALRQAIARVDVRDERSLGEIRKSKLASRLKGKTFKHAVRHGKHLFADAGGEWVHFHFGMSGDLTYFKKEEDAPRFARVVFDFRNGAHLAFEDMRLFGVVDLTPSPDAYIEEHHLGPDPLDRSFTKTVFRKLFERHKGGIKAMLMSQDVIAGIGNLYADETLYQTSIHPRRRADEITPEEIGALYAAIRRILRDVIARRAAGRDLPQKYLIPHREEGERCPRCNGTIKRAVVAGRTTYFCGKHQK